MSKSKTPTKAPEAAPETPEAPKTTLSVVESAAFEVVDNTEVEEEPELVPAEGVETEIGNGFTLVQYK